MTDLEISFSNNYSFSNTLEKQIVIRDWVMEGLPNDSISVDNGIIAKKCSRYPLMIDP